MLRKQFSEFQALMFSVKTHAFIDLTVLDTQLFLVI